MVEKQCINIIRSSIQNGFHPQPPDSELFKSASVLALFVFNSQVELLFIQKADVPGYPWANQMAFPGGHKDKTDVSTKDTAIREMHEEMGIKPANVEIIGSLGHFQTINNVDIEAWVGAWNKKDIIQHDTDEISRVFLIPLKHLMKMHKEKGYAGQYGNIMTLQYPYKDIVIWGVTAKIIHHLLEILSLESLSL